MTRRVFSRLPRLLGRVARVVLAPPLALGAARALDTLLRQRRGDLGLRDEARRRDDASVVDGGEAGGRHTFQTSGRVGRSSPPHETAQRCGGGWFKYRRRANFTFTFTFQVDPTS